MIKKVIMKLKNSPVIKVHLLVILLYVFLSIYATFPVILKMKTSFYGSTMDTLAWIWKFWWLKYSYLHNMASLKSSMISYPFVMKLPFLYPIWDFISRWLSLFIGEIANYNLQVLFSFFLSGLSLYYLVFYFTKHQWAAFFCGAAFTLSPYHFARSWDHLCLSNMQWMVFYVLTLFVLKDRSNNKNAVLLGLYFLLIGQFSSFYYNYFMIIFTALFLLAIVFLSKDNSGKRDIRELKKIISRMGISGLVIIAGMLPQLWSSLRAIFFSDVSTGIVGVIRYFKDLFSDSATPLNYFLPAVYNPFLGRITQPFLGTFLYGENSGGEQSLFLGYVPLVLAIFGFLKWKGRRKDSPDARGENFTVPFFYFCFFAFMVISFRPYWGDKSGIIIPFPSFILFKIFPMFRNYARFGVLVMLSVCVLAGFGLKDLMCSIKSKSKKIIVYCSLFLVMLFEFLNFPPYRVNNVADVPEVYNWLKIQDGDRVIAEYPLEADDRWYFYYQRTHEKKIINYFVPGTESAQVRKKILDIEKDYVPGVLKFLGVDYVFIHKDKYLAYEGGTVLGQVPDLSRQSGLKLIKTGADIDVYEITAYAYSPDNVLIEKQGENGQPVTIMPETEVIVSRDSLGNFRFNAGTKLSYVIKYFSILPVLKLDITIDGQDEGSGAQDILINAFLRTERLIEPFFDLEGRAQSYFDGASLCSRRYKEILKMKNRSDKTREMIFEQKEHILTVNADKRKIYPYTQDPLSLMFFFSSLDFNKIKNAEAFVNAGKTNYKLLVKVEGKEDIEVNGRQYSCWKLSGEYFKLKKGTKKFADLTAWLENSKEQRLLFLRAFSKLGIISLELKENN
ncbi:MAG: DUF3108 domain-containing protein [Candidatus Omnitrophica bacterium]|nr:DUF3108 domain-containing protein [Candidatus Omnitrophota bacterium]